MAKKDEATGKKGKDKKQETAAQETSGVVTIKDLAIEFGMEGPKIRTYLRSKGYKAPEVETVGFGPKSKYEWPAGSKELAEIRQCLKELAEG